MMIKLKHTKGNWKLDESGKIVQAHRPEVIICSMKNNDGFYNNHDINSNLIIASPKLLNFTIEYIQSIHRISMKFNNKYFEERFKGKPITKLVENITKLSIDELLE